MGEHGDTFAVGTDDPLADVIGQAMLEAQGEHGPTCGCPPADPLADLFQSNDLYLSRPLAVKAAAVMRSHMAGVLAAEEAKQMSRQEDAVTAVAVVMSLDSLRAALGIEA